MRGEKIFSPKNLPKGPWEILLKHAFAIIDDLEKHGGIKNPFWTFGGGTVLMLRHAHRQSKDIDIFVPDPQYLGFVTPRLAAWQQLGYQVKLWFLSLPNEEIAVSRVARRVRQGGHNIPEDVIRRRFKAGLENFYKHYSKVVDSWAFLDNYLRPPKLIDWSNK